MNMFEKRAGHAHDKCAVCEEEIPEGRLIIKHKETGKIICLSCIMELAELS